MFGTQTSNSGESQLKALGNQTVGGLMETSTPRTMSDIESALANQSRVLDIVSDKVSVLRGKLEPVLVSVPENVAKAISDFNGSALSREINQRTLRLENLDKEISYILDSLQL